METHFSYLRMFTWEILFLYLTDEIAHAQSQDVKSHCLSPSVRNGSLANITCIFNYDINNLKRKIYVDHIPPNKSVTATPETVLECRWAVGNFTCNSKSGYNWAGYESKQLTVEIPVALPTHGGQYWCDILPSHPSNTKKCELLVTGGTNPVNLLLKQKVTTACVSQPVQSGSEAFVKCCFSNDIREVKKPIYVDHVPINGSGIPETVLKCSWMNDNMLCNSSIGYQLNGIGIKDLIIQIPAAREKHAGQYWCDVLPSDPSDIKQCKLSIKDAYSPSPSTVHENTGKSEDDNKTESGVRKDTVAIICSCVTILIVAPLILIFAYRQRRKLPCYHEPPINEAIELCPLNRSPVKI